jgi:hypothetical protein
LVEKPLLFSRYLTRFVHNARTSHAMALELDWILVHTDLVWSGRRPFVYSISKMISTLKYGLLEDENESRLYCLAV